MTRTSSLSNDTRRSVALTRVAPGAFRITNAARAALPRFLRQTHDRICTVSRTVGLGCEVSYELTDGGAH